MSAEDEEAVQAELAAMEQEQVSAYLRGPMYPHSLTFSAPFTARIEAARSPIAGRAFERASGSHAHCRGRA